MFAPRVLHKIQCQFTNKSNFFKGFRKTFSTCLVPPYGRLFSPDGFYWLSLTKYDDRNLYFDVGLTNYLFENQIVGNIDSLSTTSNSSLEKNGHSVLKISWSGGMGISDGDELYHTKWSNVDGIYDVKVPLQHDSVFHTVKVTALNKSLISNPSLLIEKAEETWLFRVCAELNENLAEKKIISKSAEFKEDFDFLLHSKLLTEEKYKSLMNQNLR